MCAVSGDRAIAASARTPALQRFYYGTHKQPRSHLADFVSAYNFAKKPKTH